MAAVKVMAVVDRPVREREGEERKREGREATHRFKFLLVAPTGLT
jgi:hypothetical protein